MSRVVPIVDGVIPIPISQREGFGIRPGTRLLASVFDMKYLDESRPLPRRDLFGGFLLSPVRKSVLSRMLKLTITLANRVGGLHKVTQIIRKHKGNILFMSVAGNGVCQCHVYFPDANEVQFLQDACREGGINKTIVTLPAHKLWRPGPYDRPALEPAGGENPTDEWDDPRWIENPDFGSIKGLCKTLRKEEPRRFDYLERPGVIEKIMEACYRTEQDIRNRDLGVFTAQLYVDQRGIPLPQELYERLVRIHFISREGPELERYLREGPRCALLADERDEMALTCLIPKSRLLRIVVRSSTFATPGSDPGVGIVDRVLEVMKRNRINVLHSEITSTELRYRTRFEENYEMDPPAPTASPSIHRPALYGERGTVDFVGAYPHYWSVHPKEKLRAQIAALRREIEALHFGEEPGQPGPGLRVGLAELHRDLHKIDPEHPEEPTKQELPTVRHELNLCMETLHKHAKSQAHEDWEDLSRRIIDLSAAAKNPSPWPPHEVEIYGTPTARCFLARSATPAPEEARFLEKLKLALDSVFSDVEQGMVSLGQNIEESTRKRIRRCDALVSVIWPRISRDEPTPGIHRLHATDWVIHEESFAMGAGKAVFRFRESRAEIPAYQRDRAEFLFDYRDEDSWGRAIEEAKAQFVAFLLEKCTE
jgi:hypothetical protein